MSRVAIILLIAIPIILGGCKKENFEIKVMEYKDTVLYLDELIMWQAILEAEFESASGVDKNVWTQAGAKEQAKTELEFRLKQVLILTQQSKENNINLSDDELVKVKADAKTFYDLLEEKEISELGITLSTVENVYSKNARFSKLLDKVIDDEEMNEDEIMEELESNPDYQYFLETPSEEVLTKATVKQLLIKTFEGTTPSEETYFSEEEKLDAKAKAEQLQDRVKSGDDFIELITEYSEDEASLANNGEYTFTYKEMTTEFSEAAFNMKIGEIRLIESIYGYHIIRLEGLIKPSEEEIAHYEKTMQDYNDYIRTNLIAAKKQELFTPIYAEWEKDAQDAIKIIEKQWEKIELGKGIGN